MRSSSWIKDAGRVTLGMGAVVVPAAGIVLADAPPAGAIWYEGHTQGFYYPYRNGNSWGSELGQDGVSTSTTNANEYSHHYRGWVIVDGTHPVYGHVEISVSGTVKNTPSKQWTGQAGTSQSYSSLSVGKWKGEKHVKIWFWERASANANLGSHGYFSYYF
jgi:hypothetical protein